jgi:signal transduction histidine kinase
VARNEYKYVADLVLDLGEVPPVLGYPSQFHQVMLNLIVNAAHAMENPGGGIGRGEIRVRSWADEHAVHISVADTGCGMTAETQARMFDPFFTTKAVGKGTGQGLTIVHNVIVEKHHGAVTVDSTPGHGSTFTLSLPRDAPATTPVDHGLDVAGQESPATSSP